MVVLFKKKYLQAYDIMKLMGILNVTPDSFSDGGSYFAFEKAVARGIQIANEGADILDIGGESTRPGAKEVSEEEELFRVVPVIKALFREISIPISIDTMKPRVAYEAVSAGASMINDVSGFCEKEMRKVAADTAVDICVMHMKGTPRNMQNNPYYEKSVVEEIKNWFEERVELLTKEGIKEKNIILDPGIGFGKTAEDNIAIIKNVEKFKSLGFPVLLGVSRKSFILKMLGREPRNSDIVTAAINTIAIIKGIDIIRVHAVKEHRDIVDLLDCFC